MAKVFEMDPEQLEYELGRLILFRGLPFRIDTKNKIIRRQKNTLHYSAYHDLQKSTQNLEKVVQSLMLRTSICANDLHFDNRTHFGPTSADLFLAFKPKRRLLPKPGSVDDSDLLLEDDSIDLTGLSSAQALDSGNSSLINN